VDSIIAGVKETGLESPDWFLLDQNKNEKWTLVLPIKIRRVSMKRKAFIDKVRNYHVPKRTFLHRVSLIIFTKLFMCQR
jgi:hypothetical protein